MRGLDCALLGFVFAAAACTVDGDSPSADATVSPLTSCAAGARLFEGHCYAPTGTAQTFDAAAQACRARGADWSLAEIASPAENNFVANMAPAAGDVWLGATDRAVEGTWRWGSGTEFMKANSPVPDRYVNFDAGEPNDGGGVSDCLRMVPGGKWRDIYCTSLYQAICEQTPAAGTVTTSPNPAPPPPPSGTVNPNALFVATTGSDTNDGRSITSPLRTIARAIGLAMPGQTVYVRAGSYGRENVVFPRSGTATAPIVLEGYRLTPGDRPTIAGFDYRSAFDAAVMPLLDGGNRAVGTAVDASRAYVTVRNLQIRNYSNGVMAYGGNHVTVENVLLSTLGANDESYTGKGIIMGSGARFCAVRDSAVVNAGAEGIMLYGDDNLLQRSRVYGHDLTGTERNAPDYYIMAFGNRNVIEGALAHRVGNLAHGGHGIGLKGNCAENVIRDSAVEGTEFQLRHRGATQNRFINIEARNTPFGLVFRDGASGNVVERYTSRNVRYPITFTDTTEDGGMQFSGADNIVRDSTFLNTTGAAIYLYDYNYADSYALRNVFENLTIDGAPYLFDVRSRGRDNVLRNSTLLNVSQLARYQSPRTAADLGFTLGGNSGSL